MKRIAFLLAMILMLSVVALVPVSAEADVTEILVGTPTIDCELDDAYLNSAKMYIVEDQCRYFWGDATETDPFDQAYCYLLHDDNYVYLYAHNADAYKFSYDDTYENKMADKPFTNDGFETQFWVGDTLLYYFCGFVDTVHYTDDGMSIEGTIIETTWTDDGWAIEVAIPKANLNLNAGDTFEMIYQVNNIHDEFGVSGSAAYCAKVPLTVTDKPAVKAPATGDALVAVLALAAVAGTALVISKKR